MGVSPRGPRQITRADVDAIMACHDTAALAEMKAYARSYFAMSGMIVMSVGGACIAALARRPGWAMGAIGLAVAGGLGVIEARRRAREWEAVADARLGLLDASADLDPATMSP
ncbi:hypothetical protein [Demequina flava]|uniref:hypothetical protein n=1 Tax=Demequina flava TaxID=1095025 RepID=UPI0007844AE2|nr:hypothetical protein [Demequina flava]